MTNFNERTNTFLYKNIPLTLYTRKDWCWLYVSGELETATYWPQVLLTIAALLSHSGWATQPWVTEAPSPLSLPWLPISNSNWNWLIQAVCGTWLYNCLTYTCFLWVYASATITEFNHVHRSRWYSDIFDRIHLFRCFSAYLHRCISWLTARSRVSMLQLYTVDVHMICNCIVHL